jgi:hypothetical protein
MGLPKRATSADIPKFQMPTSHEDVISAVWWNLDATHSPTSSRSGAGESPYRAV